MESTAAADRLKFDLLTSVPGVGDAAQGAAVAVTALAQFGIAAPAQFVVLDGDPRPVMDGAAQPHMAGLAHDDEAALTAALGHRATPDKVRKA
jgi:hypothetical protein